MIEFYYNYKFRFKREILVQPLPSEQGQVHQGAHSLEVSQISSSIRVLKNRQGCGKATLHL